MTSSCYFYRSIHHFLTVQYGWPEIDTGVLLRWCDTGWGSCSQVLGSTRWWYVFVCWMYAHYSICKGWVGKRFFFFFLNRLFKDGNNDMQIGIEDKWLRSEGYKMLSFYLFFFGGSQLSLYTFFWHKMHIHLFIHVYTHTHMVALSWLIHLKR